MRNTRLVCSAVISSFILGPLAGCESLPGNKKEQGAVIGGVGGAAAGAVVGGERHRLLGALLGGALGAGGGYLIGAQMSKNDAQHRDEAVQASRRAEQTPARAEDVRNAATADLNNDGFVTLDEVVAMRQAGLSDDEMIRRLRATGQIFELTAQQEDYLRNHNVDDRVVVAMRNMNQAQGPPTAYPPPEQTIGRPPTGTPR